MGDWHVPVCRDLGIRVEVVARARVVNVCFDPDDDLLPARAAFGRRQGVAGLGSARQEAARRHLFGPSGPGGIGEP